MKNIQKRGFDFVLGKTDGGAGKKASERQYETIESVLRDELVAIWQRDDASLETVLEKIEEMGATSWHGTLEWLGHFYLFESYRYMWDMTYEKSAARTPGEDFVLGMDIKADDELLLEEGHDRHEKTLRNLLISHVVTGWRCGDYTLEKVFEVIEDMDHLGALGAWNCSEADEYVPLV